MMMVEVFSEIVGCAQENFYKIEIKRSVQSHYTN